MHVNSLEFSNSEAGDNFEIMRVQYGEEKSGAKLCIPATPLKNRGCGRMRADKICSKLSINSIFLTCEPAAYVMYDRCCPSTATVETMPIIKKAFHGQFQKSFHWRTGKFARYTEQCKSLKRKQKVSWWYCNLSFWKRQEVWHPFSLLFCFRWRALIHVFEGVLWRLMRCCVTHTIYPPPSQMRFLLSYCCVVVRRNSVLEPLCWFKYSVQIFFRCSIYCCHFNCNWAPIQKVNWQKAAAIRFQVKIVAGRDAEDRQKSNETLERYVLYTRFFQWKLVIQYYRTNVYFIKMSK